MSLNIEEFKLKPTAASFIPKGLSQSQEEEVRMGSPQSIPSSPNGVSPSRTTPSTPYSLFAKGNVFLDGWGSRS